MMITQAVAMAAYIIFPSVQLLRPERFARDNLLTRLMAFIYAFDTPHGGLPLPARGLLPGHRLRLVPQAAERRGLEGLHGPLRRGHLPVHRLRQAAFRGGHIRRDSRGPARRIPGVRANAPEPLDREQRPSVPSGGAPVARARRCHTALRRPTISAAMLRALRSGA